VTAPLEVLAAQSWRRAFFTTYALRLSFFEAVILDLLVRSNSRDATILSDVTGVRAALSEKGAFRAGREYQVEPVSVLGGVFHAKLTALIGDSGPHLLIGSGNLTFGGWGGNLEVVEHLHPSFAPDAIEDAAQFFELLQSSPRVRHAVAAECGSLANDLRKANQSTSRDGNIRLFHNLDGSIAEKIAALAAELGGAQRLVAVAPFWGAGAADYLCRLLGVGNIFVHSHASGTVKGTIGQNWPWDSKIKTDAVTLELFEGQDDRKLHAKLFEVLCRRGRIIISGSANGTLAALDAAGNVEACVVRIQREKVLGWRFNAAETPPKLSVDELEESAELNIGVLRAELKGTSVAGQILTPWAMGEAKAYRITALGAGELGPVMIDAESNFEFLAADLERDSWAGSLLVIKIVAKNGHSAEGFVSFSDFAEMRRHVGAIAPRIISLLRGMETPADVAAIFEWFHENPERLLGRDLRVSGTQIVNEANETSERTILVSDLGATFDVANAADAAHDGDSIGWKRVLDRIFLAFQEPRGPLRATGDQLPDDADEPTEEAAVEARQVHSDIEKSIDIFEDLLHVMLTGENASRFVLTALDLSEYFCRRLDPTDHSKRRWLRQLMRAFVSVTIAEDRRATVGAAILALHLQDGMTADEALTRQRLQRLGLNLDGDMPNMDLAKGFWPSVFELGTACDLWQRLRTVRSLPEQIAAYVQALGSGPPAPSAYLALSSAAGGEWRVLERAILNESDRDQIVVLSRLERGVCPRHPSIALPEGEFDRLKADGIGVARYCCQCIILWVEP
jgi:hypothetical protein